MIFRNFDKVGLNTEEEIKAFLGEKKVNELASEEEWRSDALKETLYLEDKIESKSLDIIVSLVNRECETGNPLLCIIKSCCGNQKLQYLFTIDNGVQEFMLGLYSDTIDKANKYADRFYGANSDLDILQIKRLLLYEGENE